MAMHTEIEEGWVGQLKRERKLTCEQNLLLSTCGVCPAPGCRHGNLTYTETTLLPKVVVVSDLGDGNTQSLQFI